MKAEGSVHDKTPSDPKIWLTTISIWVKVGRYSVIMGTEEGCHNIKTLLNFRVMTSGNVRMSRCYPHLSSFNRCIPHSYMPNLHHFRITMSKYQVPPKACARNEMCGTGSVFVVAQSNLDTMKLGSFYANLRIFHCLAYVVAE